ncbi:transposase [Nostoc flagelliforme]|uniref:transposase n=1 Tax=Nostoc flagelliforme TaxID=1306274 RepID=UPI001F54AAD1|nr:transposase [Nostoc flagelliforme]
MPYSSRLTDKEWEIIEPLLLEKKKTRPPKWTKRQILNGILYQLKNGCNWSDLPKDLPSYSTVFWHYKQWRSELGVSFIALKGVLCLLYLFISRIKTELSA